MPLSSHQQQNEPSPERRMSLGSEIALQHGVHYQAKYIGSMEMATARPGTRVEILAAMRRVRYEFKARNIRKKHVDIVVSVDGIKVVLQRKKKKQQKCMDESKMLVFFHPMYRVYYMAHDSYDPQIFCYVARDGASNTFKCNVFKSEERDQAMSVVRTVGQAFELCNRLSQEQSRERHLLEEERGMIRKASLTTGETADRLQERGERERTSNTPPAGRSSPTKGIGTSGRDRDRDRDREGERMDQQKRQSIFVPKRATAATLEEEEEEAEEEDGEDAAENSDSVEDLEDVPSTSAGHRGVRPSLLAGHSKERSSLATVVLPPLHPAPAQMSAAVSQFPPLATEPSSSMAFPPSLWNIPTQNQHPLYGNPLLHPPAFGQSAESGRAQHQYSLYQAPLPQPNISPLLLSPYVQAAAAVSLPSTSSDLLASEFSPTGNSNVQRLIRSQLEQAQQQAQVAACQVQLLKDQLNTETTARLEAQSTCHQVINSNMELIDQIQQFMGKLHVVENRATEDSLKMNHLPANDVRHERSSSRRRSSHAEEVAGGRPSSSSAAPAGPDYAVGKQYDAPDTVSSFRPYQMKTLSQLRAGSEEREEQPTQSRPYRDSTDTDDSAELLSRRKTRLPSSSSSLLRRLVPINPSTPGSSVLAMPLVFGGQLFNRTGPHLNSTGTAPSAGRRKDSTGQDQKTCSPQPQLLANHKPPNDLLVLPPQKKGLRRFSLQPQQHDFDNPQQNMAEQQQQRQAQKKPAFSKGVFGNMEFKRMSFNTNPNKKSSEDKALINVPTGDREREGGEWDEWTTERRNSRCSPDKKLGPGGTGSGRGSPDRMLQQRRRSSVGGASLTGGKK